MSWETETFGSLLTESRIPSDNPDIEKRIRVKLNVQGVEKRPVGAEKEGATKQFIRKAGQFIYGKQNFHKGAFGVIPPELDGYESSADIPSFDVRHDCLPEWIYYYFKAGNRFIELADYARGVGSQRIHPKQLADLEIPLPPLEVQEKIINELKVFEKDQISTELNHQLSLVKQLRQSFLREAMQGKLVPQDPNDEPAAVLLEKIKTEKEQLIKEKKIKKEKTLPPISEDEIPFKIPENWVWCRLGEILVELLGGFAFQSSKYINDSQNQVIRLGNVKNDNLLLETNPAFISDEYASIAYKSKLIPGDILVTMTGTRAKRDYLFTLLLKEYNFEKVNLYLNQRVGAFRLNIHINKEFINFLLKEPKILEPVFDSSTGAANQANIGIVALNNILVPLPSLTEQGRIVTKLDELMLLCDNLEASIKESKAQNEALLQQVLREALEVR